MEKETKTIRKITLTFNNDLEYLLFIKVLALGVPIQKEKATEISLNTKNLAETMFNLEYDEILSSHRLKTLYERLYKIIK